MIENTKILKFKIIWLKGLTCVNVILDVSNLKMKIKGCVDDLIN